MKQELSTLAVGLTLLAIGVWWLGFAAAAKAMFTRPELLGDERRVATYTVLPGEPPMNVDAFRNFRFIFLWAARWIIRPVGWALVACGFYATILGTIEKLSS